MQLTYEIILYNYMNCKEIHLNNFLSFIKEFAIEITNAPKERFLNIELYDALSINF